VDEGIEPLRGNATNKAKGTKLMPLLVSLPLFIIFIAVCMKLDNRREAEYKAEREAVLNEIEAECKERRKAREAKRKAREAEYEAQLAEPEADWVKEFRASLGEQPKKE